MKTQEEMVRELYEIEQIKKVKLRNMRMLDLKRWDDMALTFTENCRTGWVDGEIALEGRDAIMDFLRSTPFAQGEVAITVHQASAPEIELLSPARARGTWRLYNPMFFRDGNRSALLLAFYHDEYEKQQNGQWLISYTSHEYILDESFDRADLPSLVAARVHEF